MERLNPVPRRVVYRRRSARMRACSKATRSTTRSLAVEVRSSSDEAGGAPEAFRSLSSPHGQASYGTDHDGRKVAQITPLPYKNGDQLLKHLTAIITQEKIGVDMIDKPCHQ